MAPSLFDNADGLCPQCKTQLMWCREKFNMGVKTFFDVCPVCFPGTIAKKDPQEAISQIETLQRNFEALAQHKSMSRDISRLQLEFNFLMTDIQESESTSGLETSTYEYTVSKLAASLQNEAGAMRNDSGERDSPPSLLEQVKKLRANMIEQLKRQRGNKTEAASTYALIDVLSQLEQVEAVLPTELEHDLLEELDRLQANLEHVQYVMEDIPFFSELAANVGILSSRYMSLVQEMNEKVTDNQESKAMRKKMQDMEKRHAAQVEELQSRLNALMNTTVAANAIAVDSIVPVDAVTCGVEERTNQNEDMQRKMDEMEKQHADIVGTLQTQLDTLMENAGAIDNVASSASVEVLDAVNCSTSTQETDSAVVEAEVLGPLPMDRHLSTMTVEAEPMTSYHSNITEAISRSSEALAPPDENLGRSQAMPDIEEEIGTVGEKDEVKLILPNIPREEKAADALIEIEYPESNEKEGNLASFNENAGTSEVEDPGTTLIDEKEANPVTISQEDGKEEAGINSKDGFTLSSLGNSPKSVAEVKFLASISLDDRGVMHAATSESRQEPDLSFFNTGDIGEIECTGDTDSVFLVEYTGNEDEGVTGLVSPVEHHEAKPSSTTNTSAETQVTCISDTHGDKMDQSQSDNDKVTEILREMNEHPTDGRVQAIALEKLGDMAGNRNLCTEFDITFILKVMKQFPKYHAIQVHGLRSVRNMTLNRKDANDIGDTDLVQLYTVGLAAIERLASVDSTSREILSDLGGVDVVLFSMREYPANGTIQDKCCSTIALLARSPKMRSELRYKGAVNSIRKAKTVIGDSPCSVTTNALQWLEKDSLVREWDS